MESEDLSQSSVSYCKIKTPEKNAREEEEGQHAINLPETKVTKTTDEQQAINPQETTRS